MITPHQAKYLANELTKRFAGGSTEKLVGVVAGAQVDLNPHQVDAALFAFLSPLSKGALLADEVCLGKTIEAGLDIALGPPALSSSMDQTRTSFPRKSTPGGLSATTAPNESLVKLMK